MIKKGYKSVYGIIKGRLIRKAHRLKVRFWVLDNLSCFLVQPWCNRERINVQGGQIRHFYPPYLGIMDVFLLYKLSRLLCFLIRSQALRPGEVISIHSALHTFE